MILFLFMFWGWFGQSVDTPKQPNFIILLVDDQRWDALSYAKKTYFSTPSLDTFAKRGLYFPNAFVTLSICSPSRAAILSGQYGSKNGVMNMNSRLKNEENALGNRLKNAGYQTAVFGKWHLPNAPKSLGFEHEFIFNGITNYWDVDFKENGIDLESKGFVDQVTVDKTIEYLRSRNGKPFFVFVNTFAPHMDKNYDWPIDPVTSDSFKRNEAPIPTDWNTDYEGKPTYLATSRPHTRALEYGYDQPDSIQNHVFKYALANEAMDKSINSLFEYLSTKKLLENTYVVILGDNGWFMAEYGLTSKVLAYEESVRIPFFMVGPGIKPGKSNTMAMNSDIFPTILELAGLKIPKGTDGESLKEVALNGKALNRKSIFYEAPLPVHGTYPHYAIRTAEWKYIVTYDISNPEKIYYEELYHIQKDPKELQNVIAVKANKKALDKLRDMALKEINLSKINQSAL